MPKPPWKNLGFLVHQLERREPITLAQALCAEREPKLIERMWERNDSPYILLRLAEILGSIDERGRLGVVLDCLDAAACAPTRVLQGRQAAWRADLRAALGSGDTGAVRRLFESRRAVPRWHEYNLSFMANRARRRELAVSHFSAACACATDAVFDLLRGAPPARWGGDAIHHAASAWEAAAGFERPKGWGRGAWKWPEGRLAPTVRRALGPAPTFLEIVERCSAIERRAS